MREKPCDHPEIEPARYVGARSRWQCKSCGAPILDLDCSHPPEIRADQVDGSGAQWCTLCGVVLPSPASRRYRA